MRTLNWDSRTARRLFIPILMLVDIGLIVAVGRFLLIDGLSGLVVAAAGSVAMIGFLTFLLLAKPTLKTGRLWWISWLDVAAVIFALVMGQWLVALGGVVAACLHLIYTGWYSTLDRTGPSVIQVGEPLPVFTVQDAAGTPISSSEFPQTGRVLLFYRGNWCPLCMAQIKSVAQHYRDLAERGYVVSLVSPQPHEKTEALSTKFDAPFEFYVDVDNRAAAALGILHAGGVPAGIGMGYDGDTVLPTVVIVDGQNTVRWLHETDNYRVRPEPETFLAVIDKLQEQQEPQVSDDSPQLTQRRTTAT